MKFALLIMTVLVASCGQYESDVTRNLIGESRSADALVVTTTDRNNISSICTALGQKASTLASAVGSTYLFATQQSDCDGITVVNADLNVIIQTGGTGYIFKKSSDGLDYIFPELETNTTGLLTNVCADPTSFVNPQIDPGTNSATWITTVGISSNDCTPASEELCVQVETGSLNADQTYTIHTKDWMRVRLTSTNGKLGFFTQRKKLTQATCATYKSQISQALMK